MNSYKLDNTQIQFLKNWISQLKTAGEAATQITNRIFSISVSILLPAGRIGQGWCESSRLDQLSLPHKGQLASNGHGESVHQALLNLTTNSSQTYSLPVG